jgi:hypothetical protein
MLQAGVARLRELWPNAELGAITMYSRRLLELLPQVRPLNASCKTIIVGEGSLIPGVGRIFKSRLIPLIDI